MRIRELRLSLSCLVIGCLSVQAPAADIQVVTTLSAYASIAREITGERAEVRSISEGNEDAHFVKPKPSFALMLKKADLFVTTGLDLELWAPILVDKSGNRKIREGMPGHVKATEGVPLLDVPSSASRAGGDVHAFGNPHVFTSPINAKLIAHNIARALIKIDPAGTTIYEENLVIFERRITEALYGEELVSMLGAETLDALARDGKLIDFLTRQFYEDRPMSTRLGGWMERLSPYRGEPILAYHKNWIYLTELFALDVIDYVEPKPGIPPSARHVMVLIDEITEHDIEVLLAASYFGQQQIRAVAERTGCRALTVHLGPVDGIPADYFELVDTWVEGLVSTFDSGD